MNRKNLVIVESPTKAKLIASFLPVNFETVASLGHIRDLPTNSRQIPEKLRREKMNVLGVLEDEKFTPIYVIPAEKKKVVENLKKKESDCESILIATDEDREGESIGWHIIDELKTKKNVKRLVFHEISKKAILEALKTPRTLDINLVKAQEARRVLDRLYGYLISPILWRKITKGLSAGRVQSVALRLLVEREEERMKFKSANYWSLTVTCIKSGTSFSARLEKINGIGVATSKDFNPETGFLEGEAIHLDEYMLDKIITELKQSNPKIENLESKDVTLKTPSPFITSSLQQEANRRFGFSPKYTMNLAQKLYENGYITYMRTDSVNLSSDAVTSIRKIVSELYGVDFLPPSPKQYKSTVKNAQEAHEAIRPIFDNNISIQAIERKLGKDSAKLFDLIFRRTLASQMNDALVRRTSVKILAGKYEFKASGKILLSPGYLVALDTELNEETLPDLMVGETVQFADFKKNLHQTNPPNRFTEGALVRELEKRGIGRPSTWASIVDLVTKKEYAFKKNGSLIPTFLSFVIVRLLREYFPELIDYKFTAWMEDQLDRIAKNEVKYEEFLHDFFYGSKELPGLKRLIEERFPSIDSKKICTIPVAKDNEKEFFVRVGKNSVSLTDNEKYSPLPLNIPPDELKPEKCKSILYGENLVGVDGKIIMEKYGRYGRYLEIKEGNSSRRISLKWLGSKDLDDQLKKIISELPKQLGYSDYFKDTITLNIGPYGPYISVKEIYKSIPSEQISKINFEEADKMLQDAESSVRILGQDTNGEKILVRKGRFGFYLQKGRKKIRLKDPNLDLTQALALFKN